MEWAKEFEARDDDMKDFEPEDKKKQQTAAEHVQVNCNFSYLLEVETLEIIAPGFHSCSRL